MTTPLTTPRTHTDCSAPLLITVVIPTRHRNESLAHCLDCLAPGAQTITARYEILVTDDGSDSTAEAMVRDRYPWARWVQGPRRGPAANRNNGFRHASTEWIAFTDDDCLPGPGWLAAFHTAIASGSLVLEGKTICSAGLSSLLDFAPVNETGGWLWSCNMMLHRSIMERLGGFDENFPTAHLEDVDLRERLKEADIGFVFIPDAVVDHPPKRATARDNLGRASESDVLFWYKHRSKVTARPGFSLVLSNFLNRLRWLRGKPVGKETLIWLWLTAKEVVYVSRNVGRWRRKYSGLYSDKHSDKHSSGGQRA
jgi:GT2 family glycosyltransferase